MLRSFSRKYSTPVSNISVGVLLKRKPIIMRELDEFEQAYYAFKESEIKKEARPFNHSFYFKKGTLNETRWLQVQKDGLTQAAERDLVELVTAPKVHPEEGNYKSLDRRLSENIYLCVKNKDKVELPKGKILEDELLHKACDNRLKEIIGSKNETWIVGKSPIGHYQEGKENVFFMKAHILSGKVDPNLEHLWLSKEECAKLMTPEYYQKIKDML
ncbi:54S ribosomal protein L17 mitochondrial [Boothiomyces sp. JEL0866]|nr:54S ribosomal protein L17 mitochondrial [Boothiomyces sp. JEL0866]